jgi:sugar lactone lactonase YvrE
MTKTRIRPARWTPPAAGDDGHPSPPLDLRLHPVSAAGGEDVIIDPRGRAVTGLPDGRIVAIDQDSGAETMIANTGGRPLGLENHPDGGFLVGDFERGLLRVTEDGTVRTLVSTVNGEPLRFCSNVAIAADRTIYFSASSQRFGLDDWVGDALEHRPSGRLFRLSPEGELELLAGRLAFANGVALAPDESFLVVAETCAYDMIRIDLTGERQGRQSQFGQPLPGLPDNMSRGQDGNLWVTLVAPRVPLLDRLLPRHPVWRQAMWALPDKLQPQGQSVIQARAYAPDGTLVHDIDGSHPQFGNATGVYQHGDRVWLAGILHPALASFQLPHR